MSGTATPSARGLDGIVAVRTKLRRAHVIEPQGQDHLIRPESEYIGPRPTVGERGGPLTLQRKYRVHGRS